eukprot:3315197-Rhodomonas_salina.1
MEEERVTGVTQPVRRSDARVGAQAGRAGRENYTLCENGASKGGVGREGSSQQDAPDSASAKPSLHVPPHAFKVPYQNFKSDTMLSKFRILVRLSRYQCGGPQINTLVCMHQSHSPHVAALFSCPRESLHTH